MKNAAPLAAATADLPVAKIMQQLVDTVVGEFTANPGAMKGVLSKRALAAAAEKPWLQNRFFGIAVEKEVAKRIENTPALSSLFSHAAQKGSNGRFRSIYDFAGIGRGQGLLFDITTNADVVNHMGRWYGQLVEYATYDIPKGFRLPSP